MPLAPDALLVEAQDGGGLSFAYASPGPCRTLRQLSNISLDLSAAATGCRGLGQCQITLRLAMPEAGTCPELPAPYPTVFLIPGTSRRAGGRCSHELISWHMHLWVPLLHFLLLSLIAIHLHTPTHPHSIHHTTGFSCQPSYYKTWIERLASWGFAVLTVGVVGGCRRVGVGWGGAGDPGDLPGCR